MIGEALIELKIVTEQIGDLMMQQVKTDQIE